MIVVSANFPEAHIAEMDKLVEENKYPSRSEIIRNAVRDLLIKHGVFFDIIKE